jgi:hypothetical protein
MRSQTAERPDPHHVRTPSNRRAVNSNSGRQVWHQVWLASPSVPSLNDRSFQGQSGALVRTGEHLMQTSFSSVNVSHVSPDHARCQTRAAQLRLHAHIVEASITPLMHRGGFTIGA